MKRLRLWIAILAVWLIFFFNIERILFFEAGISANIIRSDTYIFVAGVALITLLLPRLRNFYFSLLLIISTSLFLLVWYYDPNWGRSVSRKFTHLNAMVLLTIIQINAIILTGLLVRQITYSLSEFEEVIANITFSYIGKQPNPFSEEQKEMYRELRRARRYERPLSVIAIKISEDDIQFVLPQMVKEVQQAMMKEFTLARVAGILDENLQSFDTIALGNNHFIVVLPETTTEAAPQIAHRLEKAITEKMGTQLQVGTASFPDEAVTFESLIELATENADRQQEVQTSFKHKQPAIAQEV
jgi:GGDEF domain-containing protein